MKILVRKYEEKDLTEMITIWNEIVAVGNAFPQEEPLTYETGKEFFATQSYNGVAYDVDSGKIYGLYILHPNNIGRCGHICNASYAVTSSARGFGVGESLVVDCMKMGKECGFSILQFNAVVKTNIPALKLYEKLGFIQLGIIPKGFRFTDGTYEDIIPHYCVL
ncbi:MAG: GNAT family N-acetyltransferase [Lachnospirales bacterium]